MLSVIPTSQDDTSFVDFVFRILNHTARTRQPSEIYLVRIDNWFDHKWFRFSGKSLGAVGWWKNKFMLPAFSPQRVMEQRHWRLAEPSNAVYEGAETKPLHIQQSSNQNLHRYLRQVTDSGMFIWYSGATSINGRGSLMFYGIQQEAEDGWYASFLKENEWKINKTHNISKNMLLTLLSDARITEDF